MRERGGGREEKEEGDRRKRGKKEMRGRDATRDL
jgi:hypothetical protein